MRHKRENRRIQYAIEVREMSRNEHIKELCNISKDEAIAKREALLGGTCFCIASASLVCSAFLAGANADPSLLSLTGAAVIASIGTGAVFTRNGVTSLMDIEDKKDELAIYVDKDIAEAYELTKKRR